MTETNTPRVWVGCLACYNAGNLRGEWYDAIEASEVTPGDLHGRETSHEELRCFDVENMPVREEMDPVTATAWAEVVARIDDDEREAFAAYVANQNGASSPQELDELADSFPDEYLGEWASVTDYCEELADSTGMLDSMPEHLRCYFDFEAFARDVEIEGTFLHASGGGVFAFSN